MRRGGGEGGPDFVIDGNVMINVPMKNCSSSGKSKVSSKVLASVQDRPDSSGYYRDSGVYTTRRCLQQVDININISFLENSYMNKCYFYSVDIDNS